MSRLIAIGDIHGHHQKLERILEMVQPRDTDQFVFLGDYVNRGPDTKGVISFLMEFQSAYPDTIFLRGNHDQMLLNALFEYRYSSDHACQTSVYEHQCCTRCPGTIMFLQSGGRHTLESYSIQKINEIPQSHLAFIQQTRFYHSIDAFLFVHAGARNDLPLEAQDEYTLLWSRNLDPGIMETHVVGHKPTSDGLPLFENGRYLLDTGAGVGGPLTACNVRTKEFWQAR